MVVPQESERRRSRLGALLARPWLPRAGVVLAAAVVLVLALIQVMPPAAVAPKSDLPIVRVGSSSARSVSVCDRGTTACRTQILRQWRSDMADLTSSYVDPGDNYFSDLGFVRDGQTDPVAAYYDGRTDRLTIALFRRGAATEVWLQVSTGRRTAYRCGTITHQPCTSQRFLDGNRFTLTETVTVAEGMEVQYCPSGDEAITVIARNRSRGAPLEISRADLLTLVQDPRLHLPRR